MVIDHLIPKSKGGEDSFENFVLTFKDLNLGKSDKLDDKLERMKWAVKNIYAPRARKLFNQLSKNTKYYVQHKHEENEIAIKPFRTRINPKVNLRTILNDDLFWAKDKKIEILTELDPVSDVNAYEIMGLIDTYAKESLEDNSDYCIDVWLPKELSVQIKSIWHNIDGQYFKVVKKTKYYDSKSPDKWAYVYFTKHYIGFLKWREEVDECLAEIFNIDDEDIRKEQLRKFCAIFPPPDEYANDMLN